MPLECYCVKSERLSGVEGERLSGVVGNQKSVVSEYLEKNVVEKEGNG